MEEEVKERGGKREGKEGELRAANNFSHPSFDFLEICLGLILVPLSFYIICQLRDMTPQRFPPSLSGYLSG